MDKSSRHTVLRLASLSAALAKLSAEVIEVTAAFAAGDPNQEEALSPSRPAANPAAPTVVAPRRRPASKEEVIASVKAAREAIGQQNQPLPLGVLYHEATAKGFIINTPKPVQTYGARLRDYHKRVGLTYLDGFGWWAVERPYPPANYLPANVMRVGKHAA